MMHKVVLNFQKAFLDERQILVVVHVATEANDSGERQQLWDVM